MFLIIPDLIAMHFCLLLKANFIMRATIGCVLVFSQAQYMVKLKIVFLRRCCMKIKNKDSN